MLFHTYIMRATKLLMDPSELFADTCWKGISLFSIRSLLIGIQLNFNTITLKILFKFFHVECEISNILCVVLIVVYINVCLGRTTIGSGQAVDIVVQGTGVEPTHCHICLLYTSRCV